VSFWSSLINRFRGERKYDSLDLFRDLYGGRATKSGVSVSWETALNVTTWLACGRVIGEGIAQVPLKLYREANGRRMPATEHPLYEVLHRRPNEWQTSFDYREMLALHLVFTGGAFSYKNVTRSGGLRELVPFEPQWVKVEHKHGVPATYTVTLPDGESKSFAASEIWHLRGPSWNSYVGLEPVKLAREALGLALATEETHAQFHHNGAKPSGVLSVEGSLTPDQYKQLRAWIEKSIGSRNAGVPLIVDRAAKWTAQAMSGVDAQHLETRKHQVEEICRALRVMPIMVGHADKTATYASAEQMFLAHVVHTLSPWYERIEQSIDVNLLTKQERADGMYAKFVEEGLLRGSLKDTKDMLLGYVNGGLMTPNEGRAKLDLNPDPDPESDELRVPANVVGAKDQTPDEQDATAKALADHAALLTKLDERTRAPSAPPTINVHQAPITVHTPAVSVANHLPEQAPPVVDVKVEAVMPESPAPEVHAHFEATLPEVKAPDVKVDVTNNVQPAEVRVHLPARKTESEVQRDRDGNLVRVTQIETDLAADGKSTRRGLLQ
jgi:HK97 family phage portal protein